MYTRHFIALKAFAVLIKYVSEETANGILNEMRDVNLLLEHNERKKLDRYYPCLLYTSPSPRDLSTSRMPSSA